MKKVLTITLILLVLLVAYAGHYMRRPLLKGSDAIHIMVYPGEGLGKIIDRADSLDLNLSPLATKLYIKFHGAEKKIQPGRYTVRPGMSRLDFLRRLRAGEYDFVWVTIPEGLTIHRAIERLANASGRPIVDFLKLLDDRAFLDSLPFSPDNLEGYLFPETYKVPYYAEANYLLRTMLESLYDFLDSTHLRRAREIGFSVKELLTFASLIEAETADRAEMPIISSVFHNRLKRGMLLQCDPTVIYAIGGLDRPLLLRDLKYDSPYNTYLYSGLPPGPINSPGRDAIMAALYPNNTDYLFFVAGNDGKHIFSRTNAQHEQARREIKNQKSN